MQLANHLMNIDDNDHVTLAEVRGFIADDLHGAMEEAWAISTATRCKQFLFSLSLNPPKDAVVSEENFLHAVEEAEVTLGLVGQPRAIVFHEKNGRKHCHVVWSRIDGTTIKAINLPHFKNKLTTLSKELYLAHGWELPQGLKIHGGKSPLNFTLAEWQQAKRLDIDPRELKQLLQETWKQSDDARSFAHALEERGYFLARGDRRGVVITDVQGNVFSLSRWLGVKTSELKTRLNPDNLPPLADVQQAIKSRMTEQVKGYIAEVKQKHKTEKQPLEAEKQRIKAAQIEERKRLKHKQEERWQAESKIRSERLHKGLRGLWQRINGDYSRIQKLNEREALQSLQRDKQQREFLFTEHIKERQTLQTRFDALHHQHAHERKAMARKVILYLRQKLTSDIPPENTQNIQQKQEFKRLPKQQHRPPKLRM